MAERSIQHSERPARAVAKAALEEVARLPDLQNLMLSRTSLAILANGYLGLEEQLEVARDAERLADRRYFAEIKNYEQAEQRAERLQEQLEAARTIIEAVAQGKVGPAHGVLARDLLSNPAKRSDGD